VAVDVIVDVNVNVDVNAPVIVIALVNGNANVGVIDAMAGVADAVNDAQRMGDRRPARLARVAERIVAMPTSSSILVRP
jgi:hypothetical protein